MAKVISQKSKAKGKWKQERSEQARVKNGRKDKKKRATAIKQTKGER